MRKKRTLLVSCAVILLCMCLIVGGTYALMSDAILSNVHLIAGDLELGLKRTYLEYTRLNADGFLERVPVTTEVDFTESTTANVFGLDEKMTMVPGSYFEVEMQLTNAGNVAFDYSVQIKLDTANSADDFADQLKVQIYTKGEDPAAQTWMKLSELTGEGGKYAGTHVPAQSVDTVDFIVRVEFTDLDGDANNAAQEQEVKFDMVVTATQSTYVVEPTTEAVTQ